jgi:hypothetical protein
MLTSMKAPRLPLVLLPLIRPLFYICSQKMHGDCLMRILLHGRRTPQASPFRWTRGPRLRCSPSVAIFSVRLDGISNGCAVVPLARVVLQRTSQSFSNKLDVSFQFLANLNTRVSLASLSILCLSGLRETSKVQSSTVSACFWDRLVFNVGSGTSKIVPLPP